MKKNRTIIISCCVLLFILSLTFILSSNRITKVYRDGDLANVADADNGWIYYISGDNSSSVAKMDLEGKNISGLFEKRGITGVQAKDGTIYFSSFIENQGKGDIFTKPTLKGCKYGLHFFDESEVTKITWILKAFNIDYFYVTNGRKIAVSTLEDNTIYHHNSSQNWYSGKKTNLELSNGWFYEYITIADCGEIIFVDNAIIDVNPDGISCVYNSRGRDPIKPLFMQESKIYLVVSGFMKEPYIAIVDENLQTSVHYLNEIPKNQRIDRAIVLGDRVLLNTCNKISGKGEKLFELNPKTLEVEEIISLSGQEVIFAVTDQYLVTYDKGTIYKSTYGNGSLQRTELADISKEKIKKIKIDLAENWMFLYEVIGDGTDEEMVFDLKYKINLKTDEVVKDG